MLKWEGFAEKEGFKFTTVWVANALVYRLIGHYRRLKSRKPMIFLNMTRVICCNAYFRLKTARIDRVKSSKVGFRVCKVAASKAANLRVEVP